ncbi:MAG: hypothetical protein AMS16_02265 [Planctomycetes bacterium DG_58]|nr:MAG: hypothetical protein AMS16_02265 [Planctomycetes bacterium DG_58]
MQANMKRYIRKRFLIVMTAVVGVILAAYATVCMLIDPEAVREKAVATLSELTGAEVRIGGASFDPIGGLNIDDLVVSTRDEAGGEQVLARVTRARLMHRLMGLMGGKLTYSYIDIRDAQIFIERTRSGRFNLEPVLEALGKCRADQQAFPTIRLDRARIRYVDHLLTDDSDQPLNMHFQNVSVSIGAVNSGSQKFRVSLSMNDPDLGRWTTREGEFDTEAGTFSFKATSSALALTEALTERFSGRVRDAWERFSPHGGSVKLSGSFRYDRQAERPVDFDIRAQLKGASASYWRFPYEITDVHGALVCRPEGVKLENLRGRTGRTPVTFEGSTGGYRRGAPVDMRIEAKGVPLDAKLRAAFKEPHQKLWDDFRPCGWADVTCKLDRQGLPGEKMRVRVLASSTAATPVTTTYRYFPYPLELDGCVFYDAGVMTIVERPGSTAELGNFEDGVLLARHEGTVLEVRGGTGRGAPHAPVKLVFRPSDGGELPLDEDLKQALSPSMRQIWDYLDLTGSTRGTCRVERSDPQQPQLDVVVELTDIKSRVRCRDFPYELHDPEGSVLYERRAAKFPHGRLLVQNLSTHRGGTLVEINGELSGFHADKPVEKMELTIQAANLSLDDDLRRAVPPKFAAVWNALSPTPQSRVNVACRLERDHPDMPRADLSLRIESIDSSLTCSYFPYRVDRVRGSAEYTRNERFPDGLLQLRDFECHSGVCPISVRGLFAGFATGKGVNNVHLVVEGKAVPLDNKLRLAFSAKHRGMYDSFRPEGLADVVCTVKRVSRTEPLSTEIFITPLGSSICCDRFPLRLTDVAGRIHVANGVVKVTKMRGRGADGVVMLDGVLHSNNGKAAPEFTVSGTNITLGPDVEAALPEKHRELLRKLKPRGSVTFAITVKQGRDEANGKVVEYSGLIRPEDVSLELGLRLAGLTGVVHLSGTVSKTGHDFRGRAAFPRVTIKNTRFTHVDGSFEKHGNLFNVYKMSGKVYGGEVAAQLRMHLKDPITYGIVADARSLHLSRFLRKEFQTKTDKLHGLLSGKLLLQGRGTDAGSLVGRADLRVTEGRLWEIPFVLALLKVLNFSPPERTAFTDATAKLEFYNRHVDVKQMNLLGNLVSIYGEGTVKWRGAVKLHFATGLGRLKLPELPLLSPVVRGIQKQIVLVRMTGTLREPKLEVLPAAPFTAPMKDIVDTFSASGKVAKEPR